jgi:hypothetical protein
MNLSATTIIVLILLWMAVAGFGIAAALNSFEIVNARRPENERFDWSMWYPGKWERLHREYRRMFPSGKLLKRQGILGAYMLACGVLAGLLLMGPLVAVVAGCFGGFGLWFGYFRNGR